jgi:hypothetical protein
VPIATVLGAQLLRLGRGLRVSDGGMLGCTA